MVTSEIRDPNHAVKVKAVLITQEQQQPGQKHRIEDESF
jgi:hypothetical protein